MQKKKTSNKPVEASVERFPEWEGFTSGAPVKVTAAVLEGKRGYTWEFRCFARNLTTGAEWVEVYGGNFAHQGLRAFKAHEVHLIPQKKRRTRTKK
jgi:hypothetical protein